MILAAQDLRPLLGKVSLLGGVALAPSLTLLGKTLMLNPFCLHFDVPSRWLGRRKQGLGHLPY